MGNLYGYIRISAKDQNTSRQLAAMEEACIPSKNLFIDKQSGKDFQRPQYRRMMRKLQPGDCIFVKSIDRLGRNYDDIIEQWRKITKEKHADIVVLDMSLLDTREKERDLTGAFIADLVLQILSYVAQTERENIRQRQAEGIAAAKARGVRFGNPPKPLPKEFHEVVARWRQGEFPDYEAARILHVSRSWLYRKVKELRI